MHYGSYPRSMYFKHCHSVSHLVIRIQLSQLYVRAKHRLVAGLPPRWPGFDPGSVHVGFVVDKVALGQVFPRVLRFSPVIFIPPVIHYLEK
jgi:hypothetical protein